MNRRCGMPRTAVSIMASHALRYSASLIVTTFRVNFGDWSNPTGRQRNQFVYVADRSTMSPRNLYAIRAHHQAPDRFLLPGNASASKCSISVNCFGWGEGNGRNIVTGNERKEVIRNTRENKNLGDEEINIRKFCYIKT